MAIGDIITMTLIPTDAGYTATSVEVFEPDDDGYCDVVIVYRVTKAGQTIFFPVHSRWPIDNTLLDVDLHDTDLMNDVLALYGYVLP